MAATKNDHRTRGQRANLGFVAALLVCSAFLPTFVQAAGNQERVLIQTVSETPQDTQERVSYQCTFRNLWTKERQPKNFPEVLARWNGPVIWTHTLQFEPWREGDTVTRGVEKLAEVRMYVLL